MKEIEEKHVKEKEMRKVDRMPIEVLEKYLEEVIEEQGTKINCPKQRISTLVRDKKYDNKEISIGHSAQNMLRKEVKSLKEKVHKNNVQVEDCKEVVQRYEILENTDKEQKIKA